MNILTRLLPSLIALNLLAMSPAHAGGQPVGAVIELFTSQGCSSCPPADRILAGLAKRDDLITIAWHVDYWDYLGWKDTLGLKAATQRQKDYAASLGTGRLVTPQFVINGAAHVDGASQTRLAAVLDQAGPSLVQVGLERIDGRIRISLPQSPDIMDAMIELVTLHPMTETIIERGENRGETIAYVNAVAEHSELPMWDGTARALDLPDPALKQPGLDCVVLIRAGQRAAKPGVILGAAHLAAS